MEEQESKSKETLVILPEPENEEDKKKRRKRIIMLLVMMFILVADISGILAYFATMKDYHKGDSDTPYVISEESVSIYQNLLTFVKNACGADHPKPNKIIAINYSEDKLLVSSTNDFNEIYVTYNHSGGIENALNVFTNGVPSLEGYSVDSIFTVSNEKTVNCENYTMDGYRKGIVSKSLTDNYYISFTGLCSCGAYKSLVHTDYVDSGVYENILSVKQEDNKIIFDLLYIILNEI